MLSPENEREFLSLAAVWLGCRLQIMGGEVEGKPSPGNPVSAMEGAMLGAFDYAYEMKLTVQEWRNGKD